MKVCKFGGSSLADAGQISKVMDIVLADPARRMVVVSAPGKRNKSDTKVTDLLIALADGVGKFQETVRQRGLTVVNVGNDGEIAFESDVRCHARARIRDKRP